MKCVKGIIVPLLWIVFTISDKTAEALACYRCGLYRGDVKCTGGAVVYTRGNLDIPDEETMQNMCEKRQCQGPNPACVVISNSCLGFGNRVTYGCSTDPEYRERFYWKDFDGKERLRKEALSCMTDYCNGKHMNSGIDNSASFIDTSASSISVLTILSLLYFATVFM